MRKALHACLLIIALCAVFSAAALADDNTAKGTGAADQWLKLIDDGAYAESWRQAATLFRNNVSSDAWVQQIGAVRGGLGPLISRHVVESHSTTSLPGVPDGQYLVIHYASSFKNKESAVETVTSMRDQDGGWRVAGYYIE